MRSQRSCGLVLTLAVIAACAPGERSDQAGAELSGVDKYAEVTLAPSSGCALERSITIPCTEACCAAAPVATRATASGSASSRKPHPATRRLR